jgi:hypothetical protein
MANKQSSAPTPEEFVAMRRRRNYAVLAGIVILCLIFYAITFVQLAGA